MSEPIGPKVTARHYQGLCGFALAAIFLLQMQQNVSIFLNALLLVVGAISTSFRARLSPAWLLLVLAITHLLEQHQTNQGFAPDGRSPRFLDVGSVLLCMAVLTYTIAQYRLFSLRFGIHSHTRTEESLSMVELAGLILPVPLSAVVAEVLAAALRQHWDLIGLPPRWKQLFALLWMLIIGMFLVAQVFRFWQRTQMTRALGLMAVQDELWAQTRGEQRSIARWIVWRKLLGR